MSLARLRFLKWCFAGALLQAAFHSIYQFDSGATCEMEGGVKKRRASAATDAARRDAQRWSSRGHPGSRPFVAPVGRRPERGRRREAGCGGGRGGEGVGAMRDAEARRLTAADKLGARSFHAPQPSPRRPPPLADPGGELQSSCSDVEHFLANRIVGQNESVLAVTDAVCEHLHPGHGFGDFSGGDLAPSHARALVISLHGPPGVGKSYTHELLARALFMRDPFDAAAACPGPACPQYRVLFGMDWTSRSREAQARQLRLEIVSHLERHPGGALLVVSEYDKLDCSMRTFFRVLFDAGAGASGVSERAARDIADRALREGAAERERGGGAGRVQDGRDGASAEDAAAQVVDGLLSEKAMRALRRSVIILESNLGMAEMLRAGAIASGGTAEPAGSAADPDERERLRVRAFAARTAALKRAVHDAWLDQQCESATDTARLVQQVGLFVPYAPLDVRALEDLAARLLAQRAWNVRDRIDLVWDRAVVDLFVSLVEVHDGVATEGGKEITDVVGRQLSRALREFSRTARDWDVQERGVPRCSLRVSKWRSAVECG